MFILTDCCGQKQDGSVLFEHISFKLNKNDRLALIGEEGNGKSTLLKVCCGLETDPLSVKYTKLFHDEKIGILPQRMDQKWSKSTILEYLLKDEPEDDIEISRYNECAQFEQLWVKMKGQVSFLYRDQLIETLSGGEKVRIQLLKLIAQKCTMLALDEPTNDLDISTLQWLEDIILRFDGPVLFVSHDEMLLRRCANRVLHLELRNKKSKAVSTLFEGSYDQYVKERLDGLRRVEHQAASEKRTYRKKMDRLNDLYNAVRHAQNSISRQDPFTAAAIKRKMHSVNAMKDRIENEGYTKSDTVEEAIELIFEDSWLPASKVVLELKQRKLVIGDRVLIEDYDFSLYGQDHVVLMGDNGSGKSCLMKSIKTELERRDDILVGYMPQNYEDLMDMDQTPIEFLSLSSDVQDTQISRDLLGSLNFKAEEMSHPLKKLSDGQKAKIYFAKFVKMRCNVLLLDEPTRNLSPMSQPVIHELINSFEGCVFCISHDRWLIEQCFETQWILKDKQLNKMII